jgi:hypothetical protein
LALGRAVTVYWEATTTLQAQLNALRAQSKTRIQPELALTVEFVPVAYDHDSVARDIERAGLPPEFAETIRAGLWRTRLETLPVKERTVALASTTS